MDFEEAQQYVLQNSTSIDQHILLKCYGLFKVATVGVCSTSKPAFYELQNRAKWEAWVNTEEMNSDEAKERYIDIVKGICMDAPSKTTGIRVSTMEMIACDTPHGTIFDLAREGNLEELKKRKLLPLKVDANNMSVLHWAADRGHFEMIEYLLDLGLDCNLKDLEGCTALHHAAYSGNRLSYEALVKRGARPDALNLDGETPEDLVNPL
jgi:acyl-CoA-binding protein